jgi:tetraacyldisaccharide 4'-kinase
MHEPAFWHRPSSLTSRLLTPIAALYGAIAAQRLHRPGTDAGIPVICVGNYHVGGAGKTPTVLALVHLLRDLGERPCVLSRGYGGRLSGPLHVDAHRHAAVDVGDEPLMMARHVPVVVARDRIAGAALARADGASVIVMDDGFQNPALRKDASIIVVDAHRGLGNGRVFPAGPLRAPLLPQLARTDALIVIGEGAAADAVAAAVAARSAIVLHARLTPDADAVSALRGRRVLAFAGIGDPARFFRTLHASGIEVAAARKFPDHHAFSASEIAGLAADAKRDALTLVTTEKDLARLRSDADLSAFARDVVAFPVTLGFDDAAQLRQFVTERLKKARGG